MTQQTELSIVRITNTPTEAQLLKNALAAVEIHAYINDANLLQANDFLTGAVGGVKLLVAPADLERAQLVLDEWDHGAFLLEGEKLDAPPSYKNLECPVFSPEAAMAWSMILTPAFAFAIEIANLKLMKKKDGAALAWGMFSFTLLLSLGMIALTLWAGSGYFAPLAASLGLSFISVVSYFFLGKEHSRILVSEYGAHYARRPLALIAIMVGLSSACVAWFLSYFLEL